MAHVIAKSSHGPRGKEILVAIRDSYENLILLCANHHLEVDQNPQKYPVERLHEIKRNHEKIVASHFDSPQERKNDTSFLNAFMQFVPFTRLQYFIEHLPLSIELDFHLVGEMFEALLKDNPHLYPLNDIHLQKAFDRFIRSYYYLWNEISGFTNVNGRQLANFSQSDNRGFIHMERRHFSHEQQVLISEKLEKFKSDFLSSYSELISFLRTNYKNVNLNAYNQVAI